MVGTIKMSVPRAVIGIRNAIISSIFIWVLIGLVVWYFFF